MPTAPDGRSFAHTRETLVRNVDAGARAEAVSTRVAELRDNEAPCDAEALDRALWTPTATLSDAEIARAVHAMTDPGVLDAVMIGWSAASGLNPDVAPTVEGMRARLATDATRVERLVELAACLIDAEAAPVLSCLAVAAYAVGDGATANIALTRLGQTRARLHPFVVAVQELSRRGLGPARHLP